MPARPNEDLESVELGELFEDGTIVAEEPSSRHFEGAKKAAKKAAPAPAKTEAEKK